GINFILAWSGTVGAYLIKEWVVSNSDFDYEPLDEVEPSTSNIESERREQMEASTIITEPETSITETERDSGSLRITPVLVYIAILFLVIGYGSTRISLAYVPFYQKGIESLAPVNLTKVGCVVKAVDFDRENSYYVDRTRDLASNGIKFILWSEATAIVSNKNQLDNLSDSIKNVSRTFNVYVGFTYVDSSSTSGKIYNKLTVISPTGDVLIDYAKANLVPFVEDGLSPGENVLQTSVTPDFGTIGGAICFDYNFPKLIGQASTHSVDLMLVPSWDW
ncbi:2789_t:CDS:1, partial [Acaulospora colombiana]